MEPPSFAKEAAKASEGSPKKSMIAPLIKAPEASKDSKKRVWGFLNVKSAARKALEQAQRKSLEQKNFGPSTVLKDMKDSMVSSSEQPPKKKSKQTDSQPPPG